MHVARPPLQPAPIVRVADVQPAAIGKVLQADGSAWIVHDGQRHAAQANAPVFQGDTVETAEGAQVSLVFADRSTFVLKDKGALALDEFTYDAASKQGKETFLVARGAFNFVSGDIAKTAPDHAVLATPSVTIGIRGTTVAGQIGSDGATSLALLADPGSNFVGEISVGKLGGGESVVINTAGSGIIGATGGAPFAVSANAGAAIAAFVPPPAPPPATPPSLPAPTPAPGGDHGPAGDHGQGQGQHGDAAPHTEAQHAAAEPPPPVPPPPPPVQAAPPAPEPVQPPPDPHPQQPQPDPHPQQQPPPQPEKPLPVTTSESGGSGYEGHGVTGAVIGTDSHGDAMTYQIVGSATGAHGTLSLNPATGTFTYTASDNATGTDTFTVRADNGHGGTADQTVTIHLNADPIGFSTSGGTGVVGFPVTGTVTATDPAGDSMTYALVGANGGAASGTLSLNTSNGHYTYTPNNGSVTTDTFQVSVTDGHGDTATTTVTITEGSALNQTSPTTAHVTVAANLVDTDFGALSGGTTDLIFDDPASGQSAVLGAQANSIGIVNINASATGGFTLDAAASTLNLSVLGGTGNDTLTGGTGDDTINGGGGNDTITGGLGADVLTGGGGSNLFVFTSPTQSLDSLAVRDTITDFVTGTDHIRISLSGAHVDVSGFESVVSYNAGQASLTGGVPRTGGVIGDGFYSTGDQALYVYVGDASSAIATDGGYVIGSANAIGAGDLQFDITGTGGNDTLVGGVGDDTIAGGAGDDTMIGGGGNDTIIGGGGSDTVSYELSGVGITADMVAGTVGHGAYTDSISGITTVIGSTYNDVFITDGSAATTIVGHGGNDTYVLAAMPTANLVIDDSLGTSGTLEETTAHSGDYMVRDEAWSGSNLVFTMETGATVTLMPGAADYTMGQDGHTEHLTAAGGQTAGDDLVIGNAGDLTLAGGGGNDRMVWVSGVTEIDDTVAPAERHVADFHKATGDVTADLSAQTVSIFGESGVTLTGIDGVIGGSGNDTLTGGVGDEYFRGGDGNNVITGGGGFDTVSYADSLTGVTVDLGAGTATHGAWTDTLSAISGVEGSDFNDTLIGSTGSDRLDGGLGTNTLTGGVGADTFVAAQGGLAVITDFEQNIDNIELDNSQFHFGTAGTLASGNFASGDSSHQMGAGATDYSGGGSAAGIVAIDDGSGGATVWYTADMHAATTANSHEIAHVTNLDTTALDHTQFHLHV